jgi:hypothetical protein
MEDLLLTFNEEVEEANRSWRGLPPPELMTAWPPMPPMLPPLRAGRSAWRPSGRAYRGCARHHQWVACVVSTLTPRPAATRLPITTPTLFLSRPTVWTKYYSKADESCDWIEGNNKLRRHRRWRRLPRWSLNFHTADGTFATLSADARPRSALFFARFAKCKLFGDR